MGEIIQLYLFIESSGSDIPTLSYALNKINLIMKLIELIKSILPLTIQSGVIPPQVPVASQVIGTLCDK